MNNQENDIISTSIAQLGRYGLNDNTVVALIQGLINEYPQNNALMQLNEALGWEQEHERGEDEFPWILFSVNETAYGINSKYVLSIEILREITPVVDAPHYSPGITRSRGEMIEILDIRALFGSGDYRSAKTDSSDAVYMMVVMEVDKIKRGLIVDEIISVEHMTKFDDGIKSGGANRTSRYVERIALREKSDEPVLVINPNSLSL